MREIIDVLGRFAQVRVYAVLTLVITIFVALCGGLFIGGHFGYAFGIEEYLKVENALKTGKAGRYGNIILSCEHRKWKENKPVCNIGLLEANDGNIGN